MHITLLMPHFKATYGIISITKEERQRVSAALYQPADLSLLNMQYVLVLDLYIQFTLQFQSINRIGDK